MLAEAMPQIVWTPTPTGGDVLNERWFEYTGLHRRVYGELARVVHPDELPPTLVRRAAASLDGTESGASTGCGAAAAASLAPRPRRAAARARAS